MRTCIAVLDAQDGTMMAFIPAREIYQRLTTMGDALLGATKVPKGAGAEQNPFIIDSFGTILGYIDKRNGTRAKRMWFRFFGIDMYQNGNDVAEQQYYVGLKGSDTLSYPDMRMAIDGATADPSIKSDEILAATGISASSKAEVLAVACLTVGEGRRDRLSLVMHLLLFDLITDQVKYGANQDKVRSLSTAVDKQKSFVGKYDGVTAGGDSPMSQKNAVDHAHATHAPSNATMGSGVNRYLDKTTSLLAQWFAAKYRNPGYSLLACRPADEAKLSALDEKVEQFLKAKGDEEKKKKSEKAWQAVARGRKKWQPGLEALKQQVVAELSSMLQAKIDKVAAGQSTGFVYDSQKQVDTKVLKQVLADAI